MDADDISTLDRLEVQFKYLVDNKLDLIGGNANLFNTDDGVFHVTKKLKYHNSLKLLLKYGDIGIIHPTFFAKAEVFEKIGGYNEAHCAEDLEILNRVVLNGFRVGNVDTVVLNCRFSEESITKKNAHLMFFTVYYVNSIYREALKNKSYYFDPNYIRFMDENKFNADVFTKKQIIMSKARCAINQKKFLKSILYVVNAIKLSNTTIFSLKINIISLFLNVLERFSSFK